LLSFGSVLGVLSAFKTGPIVTVGALAGLAANRLSTRRRSG